MKQRMISLCIVAAMLIWLIPGATMAASATSIPSESTAKRLTDVKIYDELNILTDDYEFHYDGDFLTGITHRTYGEYAYESSAVLTYDTAGRLISNISSHPDMPEMRSGSEYTYNSAGQLISSLQWEGGAVKETYEYDATGKRIRAVGSSEGSEWITEYSYNEDGLLIGAIETDTEWWNGDTYIETIAYSYDQQNRLSKVSRTGGYSDSLTTYNYQYQPFAIYEYFDRYRYTSLLLQDDNGYTLHSFYLSNPEFFADSSGYLAKVVDKSSYSSEVQTYIFYYNGVAADAVSDNSSLNEPGAWTQVYRDFIIQDRMNADYSDDWKWVGYELVYLDDDTIPELWITYSSSAEGCRIVSYRDGKLTQKLLSLGTLYYEEYGNMFHHSCGHMGLYFDTIYKLDHDNGKLVTVAEGRNETTINEDGSQNYNVMNYFWNETQVSGEVYAQNIESFVSADTAKETSYDDQYSYVEILDYLFSAEMMPDEAPENRNGLAIYSDYSNLSIRKGSVITLNAGILKDGELTADVSGLTVQIEDTSILSVSATDMKDNCRYVKLKGLAEGTTTVVFNDSATGYTARVPVTVYDDNFLSYTLNSVPTQNIEKYPTNVYNVNGIYIDSYQFTVNDDQSAAVSFDVYSTNYTYGAVEVFDENGNMKDAVLIEKMTSGNTSIKEAVWDSIGYLVRDIIDGDLLSYRQESGYTKKTSVSVTIPKNGYIKICTDPEKSLIVGLVNSVDGLMSMASLAGDIQDFDVNSQEFSKKLTMKLLTDQAYVELIKDGSDAPKHLWKNVGKETFLTSESMGSFTDTITRNIDELALGSVIADTATDFGWNVGEKVFTYFAGPVGTALNAVFTIGKVENLIIQQNDLIQSAGVGSIYIQNQGGGLRACQQIKVESEDGFADDTALSVFRVTLASDVLDMIEKHAPDIYEQIVHGATYTYSISLMKDGSETQPHGEVTVYIPIPEKLKTLAYGGDWMDGAPVKARIYRIEEDGTPTEMDTRIEDGCFVFTTDHFSLYTIVGYDSGDDTAPNRDGNGLSTIAMIGIAAVVIAGIGAAVIIWRKKNDRISV